tara:strand:+ start:469 stop:1728 length:1260 start_codon:yes stop_codon:yes gene_type:complete
MGETEDTLKRKSYLLLSIITNLGILFIFKYFNFFNDSLKSLFDNFNIFYNVSSFDLLLPVGISFYTFQTLSYSIDIYYDRKKPERHLGIFALYVSFFPQLVAGPIERSTTLLPQFHKEHYFNYTRVKNGLLLICWGYFKKLVIADKAAILVNQIYSSPDQYSGIPLIMAAFLFAFQIYCDFSAYSDIAIGTASIMGYKLTQNFNRPYFSKSVSEFWRRWHISLSTWFRDYFYIPLGGSRSKPIRCLLNLFLTFLVSALWHGANWTFIVWGTLHGLAVSFELIIAKPRKRFELAIGTSWFKYIYNGFSILLVFTFWCFSLIFFRSDTLNDAFYISSHLFSGIQASLSMDDIGLNKKELSTVFVSIGFLLTIQLFQTRTSIRSWLSKQPDIIRWFCYSALILSILFFGELQAQEDFVYFQF